MPKYQKIVKQKQNNQTKISLASNCISPKLIKHPFSFQNQKERGKLLDSQSQKEPYNSDKLSQKKQNQKGSAKQILQERKIQVQNFSQSLQNVNALLLEVSKSIIHPSVILINSKDKINTQQLLRQHQQSKQDKSVFLCQKISNYLNILNEIEQSFRLYEEQKSTFIQYQTRQSLKEKELINANSQNENNIQPMNNKLFKKKWEQPKFLKENEQQIRVNSKDKSLSRLIKRNAKVIIDDQGAFKNVVILPIDKNNNESHTASKNSKFVITSQGQKRIKLSQYSSITKNNSKSNGKAQFQENQTVNFSWQDGKQKNESLLSERQYLQDKKKSRGKQIQSRANHNKQIDIDLTENLIWKTVNQTNKFQKMLKMVEPKLFK